MSSIKAEVSKTVKQCHSSHYMYFFFVLENTVSIKRLFMLHIMGVLLS